MNIPGRCARFFLALALWMMSAPIVTLAEDPAPERTTADLKLDIVEDQSGARVTIRNRRPMPYELVIERTVDETTTPNSRILLPSSITTLMEFDGWTAEQAREHVRAQYRFVGWMGDSTSIQHDDEYLYRLPFREGRRYRLSQGFHGKQSHQSERSRYALDFQLEIGEPVHAAREGLVVKVVDWFDEAGGPEMIDQANLIIILHDDGTMAHYVHLDHNGALVRERERVTRGQHIGRSGMTGFTRGPHLHFVVRGGRDRAIPIRFEGYADQDLSKRGKFRAGGPRRKH